MKNKKLVIIALSIVIGLVFFLTYLSSTNEKEKDYIICISSLVLGIILLYSSIKEKFSLEYGSLKLKSLVAGIGMTIVGILYLITLIKSAN